LAVKRSFHDLGGCLRKREEQFVAAMRERWIVQRVRLLVFPDDLHGIGCGLTAQNLDAAGIIVEEGIQPAAQREQSQKILFEYRVRLVIVFPSIGQDPMLRLDNPGMSNKPANGTAPTQKSTGMAVARASTPIEAILPTTNGPMSAMMRPEL
jgi:hypothetical protein